MPESHFFHSLIFYWNLKFYAERTFQLIMASRIPFLWPAEYDFCGQQNTIFYGQQNNIFMASRIPFFMANRILFFRKKKRIIF